MVLCKATEQACTHPLSMGTVKSIEPVSKGIEAVESRCVTAPLRCCAHLCAVRPSPHSASNRSQHVAASPRVAAASKAASIKRMERSLGISSACSSPSSPTAGMTHRQGRGEARCAVPRWVRVSRAALQYTLRQLRPAVCPP